MRQGLIIKSNNLEYSETIPCERYIIWCNMTLKTTLTVSSINSTKYGVNPWIPGSSATPVMATCRNFASSPNMNSVIFSKYTCNSLDNVCLTVGAFSTVVIPVDGSVFVVTPVAFKLFAFNSVKVYDAIVRNHLRLGLENDKVASEHCLPAGVGFWTMLG